MYWPEMDGRFYEIAMSFFVAAGHINSREPEYYNLSTDQLNLIDNSFAKLIEYVDNISLLFVIRQCMFFSVELISDRKHRSQIAHDVHGMIHSLIEMNASVCVFRADDELVFSFMGYGSNCVLSDWYPVDDWKGVLVEKLDISNISLRSDYEYFCDLMYSLERDYYRYKEEESVYPLFPIDSIIRMGQGDLSEEELNADLHDAASDIVNQYGDDFVAYDDFVEESIFDSVFDLDEMVHVMAYKDDNPFGEVIESEEEDLFDSEVEASEEVSFDDIDFDEKSDSAENAQNSQAPDSERKYIWVGAELVKRPVNKPSVMPQKKTYLRHDYPISRVQSFVTNITFPKTLNELWDVYINERGEFDLETVLSGDPGGWTSPKWAKKGDIIFFMHSVFSAKANISALTTQLKKGTDYLPWEVEEMMEWLDRGRELNKKYGGKIFALGRLANNPEYDDVDDDVHFGSRMFADIEDCWVLDNPIDIADFRDFILISRFSATTHVYGEEFDKLRSLILARNTNPPEYFARAVVSQKSSG